MFLELLKSAGELRNTNKQIFFRLYETFLSLNFCIRQNKLKTFFVQNEVIHRIIFPIWTTIADAVPSRRTAYWEKNLKSGKQ